MKKFLWLLTILALVMFAAADGAVFKSGKSGDCHIRRVETVRL